MFQCNDKKTYQRIPFRKFIDRQGKKVYINMDLVSLIKETDKPNRCRFYFDGGNFRDDIKINFDDIFEEEEE